MMTKSMSRFYLRLTLLPIILLTAVLLVIRSQPYDDHELRELLLPADCPAPCFMGIRPGVTTMEEAIAILEASEWIESIEVNRFESLPGEGIITVEWNEQSPAWIFRGDGNVAMLSIDNDLVEDFQLTTNLLIGHVHLIVGRADYNTVLLENYEGYSYLYHAAIYPEHGLFVNIDQDCQEQGGGVAYDRTINLSFSQFNIPLDEMYNHSWGDILSTKCPVN